MPRRAGGLVALAVAVAHALALALASPACRPRGAAERHEPPALVGSAAVTKPAPTSLPLVHRVRQPRAPSAKPPLLVLLHGLASDENDLFALERHLDDRFLVVSARAPHPQPQGGYGWWDVRFDTTPPSQDHGQAGASREAVRAFVDAAVAAYGADPARVYLCGFSQGAILSAAIALSHPEQVAGVVMMSGVVRDDVGGGWAEPERLRGLPILQVHGTTDPVIRLEVAEQGRARLAGLPLAYEWRTYPMAHQVSRDSLRDVAEWLSARLDAPPR